MKFATWLENFFFLRILGPAAGAIGEICTVLGVNYHEVYNKRWRNNKRGRCFTDRQLGKFRYHVFYLNFGSFSFSARIFLFWGYMTDWACFFEVEDDVHYYWSTWSIWFRKFSLPGTLNKDYLLELVKKNYTKNTRSAISYFIFM